MEKEENIGALLGIPQEEMAILLQVTRGQWSMFLSGRRSLPTAALLKLTEMLTIVKETETEVPDVAALNEEQARINKYLEEEIIINQHKQYIASDQLERCKKKYQSAQNVVKIADAPDRQRTANRQLGGGTFAAYKKQCPRSPQEKQPSGTRAI